MACDCKGMMGELIKSGEYPIEYHPLGQFVLRSKSGRRMVSISHCFYCGAEIRFPHTPQWTTMSEEDLAEVRNLLNGCKTEEVLFSRLGPPDRIIEPDLNEPDPLLAEAAFLRHLQYSFRWKTLILIVRTKEGKIADSIYCPKMINPPLGYYEAASTGPSTEPPGFLQRVRHFLSSHWPSHFWTIEQWTGTPGRQT